MSGANGQKEAVAEHTMRRNLTIGSVDLVQPRSLRAQILPATLKIQTYCIQASWLKSPNHLKGVAVVLKLEIEGSFGREDLQEG